MEIRKLSFNSFIALFVVVFLCIGTELQAQCDADAGQDQTICAGESIQIGGNPTAEDATGNFQIQWNNGGSLNNNNAANPLASPTTTTTYTVTINGGNCNNETDQVVVTVLPAPTVNFTSAPNNPCANTPINFTSNVSGCSGCQYSWNFGDPSSGASNTSTQANPSHTFNATGGGNQTFTVTLTVTSANGCSFTRTNTVTVKQIPDAVLQDPITNFTQCSGDPTFALTVFDASTPASNTSYAINWGDGSANWTGTTAPAGISHTYGSTDVFDLTYTVTGSNGCTSTVTEYVSNISNPSIGAANPGGTQGCGPLTICFPLNNYAANHSSTTYLVDFGDGSATQLLNHPPPTEICHTYSGSSCATGGAYTFTITANNNCDMSVATITPVRVFAAPQANFNATPVPACVNSSITFNNTTILGYNNQCAQTTLFTWAWGDGSPNTVVTSNAAQSHAYSTPGTYTVTLSAQNSCGTTTATQNICVEAAPVPNIGVSANLGCLPMTVNTTNTSTSANTCNVATTWIVDYTDLPCDPDNGTYTITSGTSSSTTPTFSLTSVGTYTLRYRMINACGTFQDQEVITVNTTPVVSVAAINSICAGTTVSPSASVDPCNLTITSYAWSFPGGTPASSTNASPGAVSYAAQGNYTISLTATNACGPTTATTSAPVLAPPNVAISSSEIDLVACYNTPITLTATGASSYSWTQTTGGGLQSSSGSSVIIYPTQNATYTVTGTAGSCADQETIALTITTLPVVAPSGTFAMCNGQTEQLGVSVSGGTSPYSTYNWSNGGTLTSSTIANPISNATTSINYTVSVTDNNGCVGTGTIPLTVYQPPNVNAGSDAQLCNQPVATQLTGFSPAGGTWSGNGVTAGGSFTPAGIGCENLTYTYTDPTTTCTGSDVVQVCVVNATQANGGNDFNVCANDPPRTLPGAGTWSGCGVSGNVYTPGAIGQCTLTYSVGQGSCLTSDQVVVTVRPLPIANAGPDQTICLGETVNLSASGASQPGNGPITTFTWSGGSVSNSLIANPTITPTSTTTLTLNVTVIDSLGCSDPDQMTIFINPLPPTNAGNDLNLCNQPIATTLTGYSPLGGSWSGPNVSNVNQFTPSGVGTFTLTYTYTDPVTTCTQADQMVITVADAVAANAGNDVNLCLDSPTYQILPPVSGGTWTPQPTVSSSGFFVPSSVGTFTLTYTLGSGTCLTTDQMDIIVNPLPVANAGADQTICVGDSVLLPAFVSGGTQPYSYSWNFGASLTNSTVLTPVAFPAINTAYQLTVTDSKGCVSIDNTLVTVNSLPTVEAGNDITVCDQQIAETLTGFSPTTGGTGVWTGTGITNPNGTFISPGVGTYWAYYTFTAGGDACANTDSIQVTVIAPVISNAGPDLSVCLNEGIQQLVGFNPPSGASWSGTSIVDTANGVFNPETSGVGTFTITIQNGQGTCFTSDTRSITVRPLPALSITPDQTVCGNAVPFAQSNFTPASGGIWEGTGITDANTGMFDPSLGSGTYNLLFRYTDPTILCSDTAYKTITVSPVPVANFSVAPLGCTNSPVVLNNTSTGATTYNWNFGNGYATAGFSPVYTYPAEGIFDIQLIASNGFGCRDTASNTNEIINPPLAVLGVSPSEGCAPLPVSFSNSSVGQYLSYFWDLTITTTTDTIPQDLVYQQGQVDIVYPISLTATNFCGSSTDNESITVHPQPVAGFGTDLDVFCSPFTVNFNDISVGNPDTWEWNFNDGSPNVFASEPVSHTFFADSIPVDYTIWLYLANECGRDTASYTITVLPNTVTSFFNTNVTSGCSPLTVEFTDYSDGADQIYYNLGDQTTDGNDNPVHTYSIPGEYCIYQYADNGCSYDTSFICIEVFASPTVDFTQEDLSVCAAEQIQFHSQVTNAVEMEWDFGDDTTSQNSDPYHTYAQGGTYNVLLTAVSDNGCTMSRTRPISVYDSPSASISVPDQIGCSPFSICFSNASTGGNFYSWDFGDGNTSGVSAPCHTFINDGVGAQLHTVRMISQNVHLCADTVYMDIVVSPQPTSAFTLSSFESCYAPQTITATNFSINANSYEWFLDNQSISTTTSGQFIIPEVGDYAIRLEASNQFGCTGSSTAVYSIHPLPIIEASATPDEGCVDLAVQFDNLTSGGTDYQWYFGDGASSTEISPSHTYTIPGAYQVQLIATTNQGCVDTLLYEPLIKAYNLPVANFIATPDIVNVYNPIFRFTDTSFDSHRWEWNFGDGGSANIPVVSHLYRAAGTFPVTLTVWNEHNCKSEITKNFTVEDIFNVWVPNTFTPDRDGINEVFLPQVSGIPFVEFYNFQVIDRWGVTIFETSDPTEPWLGNVRDGEYYGSVDSYTWQIKVILKGSDEERLYYGHVNLVR